MASVAERIGCAVAACDDIASEPGNLSNVLAAIHHRRPPVVRIANFSRPALELISRLEYRPVILWKVEYMGDESSEPLMIYEPAEISASAVARAVLERGFRTLAYSYSAFNVDRLHKSLPEFEGFDWCVIPVANKLAPAGWRRKRGGRDNEDTTRFGIAGSLHPDKGVIEVLKAFVASSSPADELALSVVDRYACPIDVVRLGGHLGRDLGLARTHVRIGSRGEWPQMLDFYALVDVMVVYSRSESWGRTAAEPLRLGVPTVMRRSACGTNQILDGVEMLETIDFSDPRFRQACDTARLKAKELRAAMSRYDAFHVRERFLQALSGVMAPKEVDGLRSLLDNSAEQELLDDALRF